MLRHDPMKRLMAMQPPDPALAHWWQQVCATLSLEAGFAYDKQTEVMTVPTDTDIEGRTGEPVKDVIQHLTAAGELDDLIEFESRPAAPLVTIAGRLDDAGRLSNSMEYSARTGVAAKDIVQRIGDTGTGLDTRLIPVSKTGNLGSAISPSPLTATDAGSDATVSIGAFSPQFDFGTLSVSSADITGLAYTTKYYIYLTGFSYADGSYSSALATTSLLTLTSNPGYFYIGTITTPAMGGGGTGGGGGGGNVEP